MKIVTLAQPTEEPVSLPEAKLHLRVDHDDEDVSIDGLITAAREWFEGEIWQTLVTTTYKYVLDCFPDERQIELPRGPLQSVTSIVYIDEDGNGATFAASNYIVSTAANPGTITLKSSASWPSTTLQEVDGVEITYVAGDGDAAAVRRMDKQAILLLVGHWYENREAATERLIRDIPLAVESIVRLRAIR